MSIIIHFTHNLYSCWLIHAGMDVLCHIYRQWDSCMQMYRQSDFSCGGEVMQAYRLINSSGKEITRFHNLQREKLKTAAMLSLK